MGSASSASVPYGVQAKTTLKAKVGSIMAFQRGRRLANERHIAVNQTDETVSDQIKQSSRKELLDFVETMKKETAEDWLTLSAQQSASPPKNVSPGLTCSQEFLHGNADREMLINNEDQTDWSCLICHDFALFAGYKCRVCGRIYHSFCLVSSGKYTYSDMELVEKMICTVKGWTCHWCEDITSLLSPDEMQELFDILDRCDIDKDNSVSLAEYLAYRRKKYLDKYGIAMPIFMECKFRVSFTEMDIAGTGFLEWREFLRYEALEILKQKNKDVLASYLSKQEVAKAQRLFEKFDEDGNGTIDRREARKVYTNWYQSVTDPSDLTEEHLDNCFFAFSIEEKQDIFGEADEDKDGSISWVEFLRCQAYFIILSRLNRVRAIQGLNSDKIATDKIATPW